jgi:hypothetical protein
MPSRGDIQRQLAQLMGDIKAGGFKFDDVMPDEMQVHFQEMVALKEARAYIKEGEDREKELRESNDSLLAQLRVKQSEIENQPAEFKALEVDLRQSQHQVSYYKELAENEQNRAERCQSKLMEACKVRTAAADESRKIQRLEQELTACIADRAALLKQHRAAIELYEIQHEEHLKIIEEQHDKLLALTDHANQLEDEKSQAVKISEQVSDTYDSLINDIEKESNTAAEVVNAKSVQLFDQRQLNDQLYSAVASELIPLHRFYNDVLSILSVYQATFRDLSSPHSPGFTELPQTLDTMLDSANDQLYAYQYLAAGLDTQSLVQKQGPAQQQVVRQVDDMASIAAQMYTSLDTLKEDILGFFKRLRNESHTCLTTKGRLGGYVSPTLTPTQRSISSRSSISSLASFAKRFSMSPS